MALLAPAVTCELGNERRGAYGNSAEKQMCRVIGLSLSHSSSSWMFGSVVSNCQSFPEAANRL
ncbi:hypothetical protein EYF80_038152 [Liparis tanakae]|uniref:Uncharacterized protein n=1 Tax=Liparis tanakae TaxID=230148 RepID=A0A4Z2GDH4_9TELE|nr:hypothetical protein EYF80_038152 [Liparis tanakae]